MYTIKKIQTKPSSGQIERIFDKPAGKNFPRRLNVTVQIPK